MKTRILFTTPKPKDAFIPYGPPIGLCYLSSYLKSKGYSDIQGIDHNIDQNEEYVSCLTKVDIVGIYASTKSIKRAFELARAAKQKGCITILGGPHPSLCPDESIANENVDFIIRGEGEETLYETVKLLESGATDFSGVAGLSFKRKKRGEIIHNASRIVFRKLDTLPFPDLSIFNIDRYPSVDISVCSTRGCPYKCTNCQPALDLLCGKFRMRSVDNVIAEISALMRNKHWCGSIHFVDNDLTINRQWVVEFCRKVISQKLRFRWACEGRANTLDKDLMLLMKKAGCRMIGMGVESGSDRVLNTIIKKGISLQQVENVIVSAKDINLDIHCWFIIGIPGETKEEMNKTMNYALHLEVSSIGFSIGTPWPRTGFYEISKKKGYMLTQNWEDFNEKGKSQLKTEDFGPNDVAEMRLSIMKHFTEKGWLVNAPTFMIRNPNFRTSLISRMSYKFQSCLYKRLGHERTIYVRRRFNRFFAQKT